MHGRLYIVSAIQLCAQVLVGDNATRLAVRLLGNIAQGRGGTLPFDTVC